jgi:LPXTG-motif cell wall-anchored protein
MVKKVFGVAALAVLAIATMTSTASAQDYPPKTNSLVLSVTSAPPGGNVTATAKTHKVGALVTFRFLSTPVVVGTATADANGVATLTFKVPADATAGQHHVESTGTGTNDQALTQSAAITVTGGTSGTVPKTGANSTKPMAEIGVGALALGGLFVLIARRRTKAHATA